MATKLVVDLTLGDQVTCVRTVTSVTRTAAMVAVVYDDGTEQQWNDLSSDPGVEVVGGG